MGFAIASSAVGQECYYTWERIRDPGGGYCSGNALNNHGVVAGTISYTGDNTRAFTWSADTGLIILPFPPDVVSMEANGINDAGQVVGKMWGGGPQRGFIWDGASYTTIDMPPFSSGIYVNDINNRGEVVGSLYHRNPPGFSFWDPYIWQDGEWAFLGALTPQGDAIVKAVNELGDIAGYCTDNSAISVWHAFVLRGRTTIAWLPEPVGSTRSGAYCVSNIGVVVGYAGWVDPARSEAVMWTPSWGLDSYPPQFGEHNAALHSVNDSRRAVGAYSYGIVDRSIVAQYGTAMVLRDLVTGSPPWLYGASAINDVGQIVASYNGGSVLLSPHWRPGDVTGDCHVRLEDLAILLTNFGAPGGTYPPGDINGDTSVDLVDLAVLLSHFGE